MSPIAACDEHHFAAIDCVGLGLLLLTSFSALVNAIIAKPLYLLVTHSTIIQ